MVFVPYSFLSLFRIKVPKIAVADLGEAQLRTRVPRKKHARQAFLAGEEWSVLSHWRGPQSILQNRTKKPPFKARPKGGVRGTQ